jgi:hypothetical protein
MPGRDRRGPAAFDQGGASLPSPSASLGRVIIHKETVPSPDPTDTTFNYTTTGGLNPATFGLKDGGTQDYGFTVPAGPYSVTESDPGPNFFLSGLNCDASILTHGSTVTPDVGTRTVSFSLKALDTVECTFTNILHQFESLAPGDPTSATVQCTGEGSSSPLPEGTPKVLDNLAPGTDSCTVVVDPDP